MLATIRSTFEASNQGSIHFGQVISQLMRLGVESYQVDYRSGRTTYYLPDGNTADFLFERSQHGIHDAFDGDAVRAAIRGAQEGHVMYPEFKRLTQQAGCVATPSGSPGAMWTTGAAVVNRMSSAFPTEK